MWVLAAVLAVLAAAMMYQSELGGGLQRSWMKCKENLFQQMMYNSCTPAIGKVNKDSLAPQ